MERSALNLLIAAHGFPGLGSRAVGLLDRLPACGVHPWVITNRDRRRAAAERPVLETLDPGVGVTAVAAMNRSPCRLFSRLFKSRAVKDYCEKLLFIPDPDVVWSGFAYRECCRIVRGQAVRAVMTISPPESAHLVGLLLKRRHGLKWIANFEDLWSTKRHVFRPATRYHDRWLRSLERRVYAECDRLVANTEGNRRVYVEQFGVPPGKIHVVTLGFAAAECGGARARTTVRRGGALRIGYMGNFDKDGMPYRQFLDLVGKVRQSSPRESVEVDICGVVSQRCLREIAQLQLQDIIRYHGTLLHNQALELMASSDVLLLLLYETDYSSSIVPHKLYHYLGLEKPVLAIAPEEGDVARILSDTNAGVVYSPRRSDAAHPWLISKVEEKRRCGILRHEPRNEKLGQFEYGVQAQRLAQVVYSLLPA